MPRVLLLALVLLAALRGRAQAICDPSVNPLTTSRLSLTKPQVLQCNWHSDTTGLGSLINQLDANACFQTNACTLTAGVVWDLGAGQLELPHATTCATTDCDAASEYNRICIDEDATSGQRIYVCESAGWVLQGGSGTVLHNFLDSAVHNNTATGTPTQGDLILANATPAWAKFAKGTADQVLGVQTGAGTTLEYKTIAGVASETNVIVGAGSITIGLVDPLATTKGGTALATYVLGDTLYSSAADTLARLAGNTTATKLFLTQTGTGTVSAAPAWGAIAAGDLPAHNFLDSTRHNNTATGTPVRGDVIVANATPAWARVAIGAANTVLHSNGTDAAWAALADADLPSLTSAQWATHVSDETGTGAWVFGTSPTIVTPTIASFTNAQHSHQNAAGGGTLDHGLALIGLTDDDHTQYALLAGRGANQTLNGGTSPANTLTLSSTASATKGKINFGSSVYDEANTRLGIGTATPSETLSVGSASEFRVTSTGNLAMINNVGTYTWPTALPTVTGQALTGTTAGVLSWATPATAVHNFLDSTVHNNTATGTPVLGDLIAGNATPAWARLAGNITTTKQFLTQTGTGAVSAAPAWGTIAVGDLPAHNFLDSTRHNNTATGTPVRGDVIVANSTPAWARVAIGGANTVLHSNGTDAAWAALADADLPSLTSAQWATHVSDETGTGLWVFGTSPTILTPTIATLNGSTAPSGTLSLNSTSNATKGVMTLDATVVDLLNSTVAGAAAELRLEEPQGGGNMYTGFKAPVLVANVLYTLPAAFPTVTGQALTGTTAGALSWAAPAPAAHNFLDSAVHNNVVTDTGRARGDLIVANATPAWARFAIGTAGKFLRTDGTDPSWQAIAGSDLSGFATGAVPFGTGTGLTSDLTNFSWNVSATNQLKAAGGYLVGTQTWNQTNGRSRFTDTGGPGFIAMRQLRYGGMGSATRGGARMGFYDPFDAYGDGDYISAGGSAGGWPAHFAHHGTDNDATPAFAAFGAKYNDLSLYGATNAFSNPAWAVVGAVNQRWMQRMFMQNSGGGASAFTLKEGQVSLNDPNLYSLAERPTVVFTACGAGNRNTCTDGANSNWDCATPGASNDPNPHIGCAGGTCTTSANDACGNSTTKGICINTTSYVAYTFHDFRYGDILGASISKRCVGGSRNQGYCTQTSECSGGGTCTACPYCDTWGGAGNTMLSNWTTAVSPSSSSATGYKMTVTLPKMCWAGATATEQRCTWNNATCTVASNCYDPTIPGVDSGNSQCMGMRKGCSIGADCGAGGVCQEWQPGATAGQTYATILLGGGSTSDTSGFGMELLEYPATSIDIRGNPLNGTCSLFQERLQSVPTNLTGFSRVEFHASSQAGGIPIAPLMSLRADTDFMSALTVWNGSPTKTALPTKVFEIGTTGNVQIGVNTAPTLTWATSNWTAGANSIEINDPGGCASEMKLYTTWGGGSCGASWPTNKTLAIDIRGRDNGDTQGVKLGFFGTAAAIQPLVSTALVTGLQNMGLIAAGTFSGDIATTGRIGAGTLSPAAKLDLAPAALTGTVVPDLLLTGAANTALTAGTERSSVSWTFGSQQWTSGTWSGLPQRFVKIAQPTLTFTAGTVINEVATVAILGPPIAGTNAAPTDSYSLWLQSGAVAGGTANTTTLRVEAPTGATNNYAASFTGGRTGFGTTSPDGTVEIAPPASSGSVLPDLLMIGASNTTLTAGTERRSIDLSTAFGSQQWATGTLATQRFMVIGAPTLTFVAGSSVTKTATLAIAGMPVAGTNAAPVDSYALWLQTNAVGSGTANTTAFRVEAATGATNNYAASFTGGNVGILTTAPTSTFSVGASNQFQVTSTGNLVVVNGVGNYTWPTALPTVNGQALTGTTGGVLSWATPTTAAHNFLDSTVHNNTATGTPVLGDLIAGNATPAWARLAGNITTTKQFLTQTGTGAVSAAPAWGTIADGDMPSLTSAQWATHVTDETGSGAWVFGTSPTIVTPTIASFTNAQHSHQTAAGGGQLDHGLALTAASLLDDDHTQYFLLAGRAGGQTARGGTAAGDDLTLSSTISGTKGNLFFGTSTYDEVNNRLGIGTTSPSGRLAVAPAATTGTVVPELLLTGAANTALTASTERNSVSWTFGSQQWNTGSFTPQRFVNIEQPTMTFVGSSLVTEAATVAINGPPAAGTNAAIGTGYALWLRTGAVGSGTTKSTALRVDAATGASSFNSAAFFNGPVSLGTDGPDVGFFTIERTGVAAAGGQLVPDVYVDPGTNTALQASVQRQTYLLSCGTNQWNTGALASQRCALLVSGSISFVAASTVTTAATLAINGPSLAGTNATITDAYSLWLQAGSAVSGGAATRATTLRVEVPTGASSNYAATFGGNVGILTATPASPLSVGSTGQFQVTSGGNMLVINGVGNYTWPTALPTVTGQVLTGTTAGVLTWSAVSASTFGSQSANTFLAAPDGAAGNPTFRTIVNGDLPSLTSAQWATHVSDETGSGLWVFGTSPTIVTPTIASFTNAQHSHQTAAGGGTLDHGLALVGLTDDDHTQYALLAGRGTNQTLNGGVNAGNTLTLSSTASGTKGNILFGTSAYDEVNNRWGIGTTSPAAKLAVVPPVVGSTTVVPDVLVTGAANTALTASTERVSVDLNVSATQTWAAGTVATERTVLVRAPTLGGSAATATFTDAATLAITGPPIETTNAAVTNAYALLIQGGAATGATNGYGLKVIAPTGAGTNFAAIFTGGNVGILSTNPTSPLSVGAADQFQVTSGGNISVLNGVGFYTWPTALPSANGQVLTGQTSGTLSWAAPAMDPTTTAELYEEFASGSYPAMDGTSHDIAKLGWMGLQSGTCAARQATAVAGAPGLLELLVDAVTSDYCLLVLNSASAQKFVVGYQSSNTWTAKFRLQHTSTTNTAIVAGFGTSNIVTPANHVDFFGIRYDTALSDTNYMCVSRASAVTTTTSTGVAASTGFHRFTLSRVANGTGTCAQGAGCLQCQVDAAAAVQTNAAMPTVAVDALTGIITRTNAEESLILDYFTYRDTGLSR